MLGIAGCAGGPVTTDALQRARAEYAKVQADPSVAENAQVASYEAAQALQKAEQADNEKTQTYLSYIAERKAQTAIETADRVKAEKQLRATAKEKDRMLVQAREEEARKARSEAEAARRQAQTAQSQAEEARSRASQMESELAELKGKQTERGVVLTLGDVLFATGKANLQPRGLETVSKLAAFLQKYPDRSVLIEGHTDSVGSAQYNVTLSQRRADSVRKALMENGISADRIAAKGYGETKPVASNKTAAGRQQNRRVEVTVLNPGVDPKTMVQ
jgi:outer membrane protein OmpA-like peptidoglycan-associated protein